MTTFFLGQKYIHWNHPPNFNIPFIGKSVSTYGVSTNVEGLGTTYYVTSEDDYKYKHV
jgi:hypothetical protein